MQTHLDEKRGKTNERKIQCDDDDKQELKTCRKIINKHSSIIFKMSTTKSYLLLFVVAATSTTTTATTTTRIRRRQRKRTRGGIRAFLSQTNAHVPAVF